MMARSSIPVRSKPQSTIFMSASGTRTNWIDRGDRVNMVTTNAVKCVLPPWPLETGSIAAVVKQPQSKVKGCNDYTVSDSRGGKFKHELSLVVKAAISNSQVGIGSVSPIIESNLASKKNAPIYGRVLNERNRAKNQLFGSSTTVAGVSASAVFSAAGFLEPLDALRPLAFLYPGSSALINSIKAISAASLMRC